MMQAWLVVEFGVADLDVCLLSRVRCGNRGETKGAKTTHRRLCNRGISQHRSGCKPFHLLSNHKKRIHPYFSFSFLSEWVCKESGHIWNSWKQMYSIVYQWRYRNSMVCRYNVVIKPVCQLGNNLIEINFLKIGSHKSQPARLSNESSEN